MKAGGFAHSPHIFEPRPRASIVLWVKRSPGMNKIGWCLQKACGFKSSDRFDEWYWIFQRMQGLEDSVGSIWMNSRQRCENMRPESPWCRKQLTNDSRQPAPFHCIDPGDERCNNAIRRAHILATNKPQHVDLDEWIAYEIQPRPKLVTPMSTSNLYFTLHSSYLPPAACCDRYSFSATISPYQNVAFWQIIHSVLKNKKQSFTTSGDATTPNMTQIPIINIPKYVFSI